MAVSPVCREPRPHQPPCRISSRRMEVPLQAAGHDGCEVAGPVFIKPASEQELAFYRDMATADGLIDGSHLSHWMPVMMGTLAPGDLQGIGVPERIVVTSEALKIKPDGVQGEKPKIVLQNLYYGFSRPSVMDIKIGKILTDNTVLQDKAERLSQVSKSTTSGSMGFRICGIKLWGKNKSEIPQIYPNISNDVSQEEDYLSFNKFFGRSLTQNTMGSAIKLFFSAVPESHRFEVITRFHQRLQLLYNCLLDSEVRIFSGSLLFICESDPERYSSVEDYEDEDPLLSGIVDDTDSDSEGPDPPAPLSRLNVIDFAHATYKKGQGYDDNIVDAVESLLHSFDRLL